VIAFQIACQESSANSSAPDPARQYVRATGFHRRVWLLATRLVL
jgi:hypothetical protein